MTHSLLCILYSLFYSKLQLDINKCSISNGGCEEICTNTNESFICSYHQGYMLCDDKRTCTSIKSRYRFICQNNNLIDINECTINNGYSC